MNPQKAKTGDVEEIAKIHLKTFSHGLLALMGEKFLKLFYLDLIQDSQSVVLVVKDKKKVVGFISGTINVKNYYRRFFKNNFLKVSVIFFRVCFNKNFLKQFNRVFSRSNSTDIGKSADLFSFAILPAWRGMGLGKKLLFESLSWFKKKKVEKVKFVVGKKLKSQSFYLKFDCKKILGGKGADSDLFIFSTGTKFIT